MKPEIKEINRRSIKQLSEECKLYAKRVVLTHLPSGVYIQGVMRE